MNRVGIFDVPDRKIIKFNSYLTPCTKANSRRVKYIGLKSETVKCSNHNIRNLISR